MSIQHILMKEQLNTPANDDDESLAMESIYEYHIKHDELTQISNLHTTLCDLHHMSLEGVDVNLAVDAVIDSVLGSESGLIIGGRSLSYRKPSLSLEADGDGAWAKFIEFLKKDRSVYIRRGEEPSGTH